MGKNIRGKSTHNGAAVKDWHPYAKLGVAFLDKKKYNRRKGKKEWKEEERNLSVGNAEG